jgi:anti-sigma regulatory factor (Ser/Thr protein kinase)
MREVAVRHEMDVHLARQVAREVAFAQGFPPAECVELAIVASELTSNILKYGVRGRLVFEPVDDPERGPGVRITAWDEGPPFRDFMLAQRDGFDDQGPLDPAELAGRRGIGAGLGAIKRFTSELGWEPTETGKRVWVLRYVKRPSRPSRRAPGGAG